MPNTKTRYSLRTGARDMALASRVLGVLYLAGGLLVAFSVLLPHPEEADAGALLVVAGLIAAVGGASLIWAERAQTRTVHAALAAGTGLISLCIYFAGVATGIYSAMFLWVVLLAASFFASRAIAAHVGWVLTSWGLALALIEKTTTGFSTITRWTLGSFVLVVAAAVMSEIVAGRKSTEERLRSAQEELEHLAHHDPLTGVANRRFFDIALGRELGRAKRHGTPVAIVALDLDQFKEYNDEHGHAAGDQLLKLVTSGWASVLRAEDLIARFGGDEFIALLPNCPPHEADQAVQRLHSNLPPYCTCCTGIAYWDRHEPAEELLGRADEALYEAKDQLAYSTTF